ncbi:MAG: IPExxxVDY family protein [Bacteroidetes bacterium]|nr:IPExxxVDY family protein [Bacteroidota bacterium]
MAVKKHKLHMAIDEDFCLLGVVTDQPDYRMCLLINRALGFDIRKQNDLILYHRKLDKDQVFSLFEYSDDKSLLTYRIIRNRAAEGFFLDELKNLDYLVHIQGEVSEEKVTSFFQSIAAIPDVRMCVPVDLTRIRNKERLWLW